MPKVFSDKTVPIHTPRGNKAVGAGGSSGVSSSMKKVQAHFSFGVDGANAVPATSLRGDPFAVVRTSQGLYTITLGALTDLLGRYKVKKILTVQMQLQKSATSAAGIEPGEIDDAAGTIQCRIVDRDVGTVMDPAAAGAHERVHVTVTFDAGPY